MENGKLFRTTLSEIYVFIIMATAVNEVIIVTMQIN